jgi:NitT/TauT family transport system substrate-binding protein
MSSRFRAGAIAALLTAAAAVTACGGGDSGGSSTGASASTSSSSATQSTTITLAFTPTSPGVCFKLTDERGLFRKRGITVKYGTAAPTGAAQIAQILNGQITAGQGAYTGVITAVSNGLPVVITNAMDQDYDEDGQTAFATIVGKSSGITSFKQLEGKSVAVNSLKGNWEVSLREAVAQAGGDPNKVKPVAVPFADQVTALKSGRVNAIYTLQPFIAQLKAQGYKVIGDPQAIGFGGKKDSVVDVTFMAKKFADSHPQVLKNWVAALQEGNAWCNAHPDEVKKAIARITKAPAEVVNQTPLPKFTANLGPTTTEDWSKLLVKYGVIKKAPAAGQVQWSGAPL